MADWSPLRELLAGVADRHTVSWADLDALVGGLPRSAHMHSAFWKGDRSAWSGFNTEDVSVGTSVTFVRRPAGGPRSRPLRVPASTSDRRADRVADVVLVGCVKRKLDRAAPAQDLYTSALFRKERTYAEGSGARWFILSAQHGLVEPTRVLEPYELRLSSLTRAQRVAWGIAVVDDLAAACGSLAGKVIEVHAGAAYVDSIREPLLGLGAEVSEPLRGLMMGERLAWYGPGSLGAVRADCVVSKPEVRSLVRGLSDQSGALTPSELIASRGVDLRGPGLYSWWVDVPGASDLALGLGQHLGAGLIYAGLAGATRSQSGRPSKNTLWGRLQGMHLGSRHEFSTFRLSLGSILASASEAAEIDEGALTAWMYAHLRVIAIPVDDADALDGLETGVLAVLDPPLNLQKMPKTAIRSRLTFLRRQYSKKTRARRPVAEP